MGHRGTEVRMGLAVNRFHAVMLQRDIEELHFNRGRYREILELVQAMETSSFSNVHVLKLYIYQHGMSATVK